MAGTATISRLTVRGVDTRIGEPALRLRTERLLDGLELRPPGMGDGETLIVRRLHVAISLARGSTTGSVESRSVRHRLDDLRRRAARPALGQVPADAEGVHFADPGEMLACLTRDIVKGQAWERWYWEAALRHVSRSRGSALAEVWEARARFLPAAVGPMPVADAVQATALLNDGELRRVTQAVQAAFALPRAAPPIQSANFSELAHLRARYANRPSLAPQAIAFLALVRALFEAPSAVRYAASSALDSRPHSSSLQPGTDIETEGKAVEDPTRDGFRLSVLQATERPVPAGAAEARQEMPAAPATLRPAPGLGSAGGAPGVPPPGLAATEQGRGGLASSSANAPPSPSDLRPWEGIYQRDTSPPPTAPLASRPRYTDGLPPESSGLAFLTEHGRSSGVELDKPHAHATSLAGESTQLGGVLYLINLLSWLGEADETDLATPLSGWALIEALARGLLGASMTLYTTDPIWAALAALDGRRNATPKGPELVKPPDFRLPLAWLRRDRRSERRWVATSGRGRVRLFDAEAGYLVADVKQAGRDAERVALAVVARFRAGGLGVTWSWGRSLAVSRLHPATGQSSTVRWWLRRTLGFVRVLLRRLLGESETKPAAVGRELLVEPALLQVGRTHVDMFMRADRVRLSIRRTGLDRDPGWVPDLGRIVLFHFEEASVGDGSKSDAELYRDA